MSTKINSLTKHRTFKLVIQRNNILRDMLRIPNANIITRLSATEYNVRTNREKEIERKRTRQKKINDREMLILHNIVQWDFVEKAWKLENKYTISIVLLFFRFLRK